MEMFELDKKIIEWARDRGILTGSSFESQICYTIMETGEMVEAFIKQDRDSLALEIGDVAVTLVIARHLLSSDMPCVYQLNQCEELKTPYLALASLNENVGLALQHHHTELNSRRYFVSKALKALFNFAIVCDLNFLDCVNAAYEKISKRTGKMANGVFVRDGGHD